MITKTKYTREETIEWLLANTYETKNGCRELLSDFWSQYWGFYPSITWYGKTMSVCRFICFEPHEWSCNLVTRHRCHNKACINPEHLMKGTCADNIRDNRYEPFEMPLRYDSMLSTDEDNWWDDDDQKEKEYEADLHEREEAQKEWIQEDWS